jgi:hypothetical protein
LGSNAGPLWKALLDIEHNAAEIWESDAGYPRGVNRVGGVIGRVS